MNRISRFYRISAPAPAREMDEAARDKYYRRLRMQAFIAATLGYSLYYVCRTSLNVMKKPILDSGSLDASQLGVIGSALLFAYAIGKFVNGFIADYCNIKRFMATGLIVSAADPKALSAPSSCEPDHNPCMGSRPPYECPAKRHSKNFIEKR